MRILSWNVNGIRAVHRKGFLEWLKKDSPDILCIQETKANPRQVPPLLRHPHPYKSFWSFADKKGYSGVAIYTKEEPLSVERTLKITKKFDEEGRGLRAEYSHFILFNLYFPHGGRDQSKVPYKLEVYKEFIRYLDKLKKERKPIILCGDFNIAHKEIDLTNPKNNVKNTMFLPEERKYIDKVTKQGYVDTFRTFNKEPGNYTWWPFMNNARERNIGWRIDYIFVSSDFITNAKDAFILPKVMGSDHCPIGIEF